MVKNNPIILAAIFCIIIFYSGIFPVKDRNPFYSLLENSKIEKIYGTISSSPSKISSGKYYMADLTVHTAVSQTDEKSSAKGKVKVFLPTQMVEALYPGKLYSSSVNTGGFLCEKGQTVLLEGKFTSGNTSKNSSKDTTSSSPVFYCTKGQAYGWKNTLSGKLDYIRALCRLQFKRLMYSWGDAGGLLVALISGAKEYTDENTTNAFKKAGLSHILALSGMHLSIFSGISVFLGKKLKRYKFSLWGKPLSIVLFVWFAGFSPSLLRAFICSILLILEAVSNVKQSKMIIILSLSFLIQAMISPQDLFNYGFLLSYGALAGILLTSEFFNSFFIRFIPYSISSSLSASTGAQIFTAPISLKLFGTFCPFGIIATLFVSPLITIFIYVGLFLIVTNLVFPVFVDISGIFINFLYTIIKNIVLVFSHLPAITIGE